MDSKVPHLQNTLKDKFCPLFLLQTNLGQQMFPGQILSRTTKYNIMFFNFEQFYRLYAEI